jgi:hypothetical protein
MRVLAWVAMIAWASIAPAVAKPRDFSGAWTGAYAYDSTFADAVEFEANLTADGARFTGKTSEPNTFGDPIAARLGANLRGDLGADGSVSFRKTYDGSGGVSHDVEYRGALQRDGCIKGSWFIGAVTGPFRMCPGSGGLIS